MKKEKMEINIEDFPKELHSLLNGAEIYDSSCGSAAQVIYSDLGYYIKIDKKDALADEVRLARIFEQNHIGVEVVAYISDEKDYMVTKSAKGQDGTHYLDHPKKLCKGLANAMKYLHSRPITNVPASKCLNWYVEQGKDSFLKQDTFIHGDFCLPNVMFEDGKFCGFLDYGQAGVGDKHIDIFWVLWSMWYNFKTDAYSDYFLDLYGREHVDMNILKMVAEVEKGSLEA